MKLSEKLAALEDDEVEAPTAPRPSAHRRPATRNATTKVAPARTGKSAQTSSWEASKRKVRDLVLADLAPRMRDLAGEALADEVKSCLDGIIAREDVKVSPVERRRFVEEVIQDTLGYGPLDPMLKDDSITEIMCNGHNEIWIERGGKLERTNFSFADDTAYRQVIDRVVGGVGRRVDEGSPMVDARLPDGSRVNAVIPPLAVHGSVLTIRKFAADPFQIKDLIAFGSVTVDVALVLEAAVRGKLNVLVSGGTGTGKTTTLNVLSSFIPEEERIITIEDSAELQLQKPHVVSLEARPSNAEGSGEVRIRDLVKNALRMRPDRIIVGECRGAEALDMLQAMNTGHEGSMTTVHANNPRDALSRLETMVLMAGFDLPVRAIREQVNAAIDVIIQLERFPDGRRVVTAITEVQGMEGDTILLQDVFKHRPGLGGTTGDVVPTGLRPRFVERIAERGVELPPDVFRVARAMSGAPRVARATRLNGPSLPGHDGYIEPKVEMTK
ncbi:MAG: CpaF family protein [Actinobacteria bacterium]|nr:CpaF family protein [Actinomycetota bacterium]